MRAPLSLSEMAFGCWVVNLLHFPAIVLTAGNAQFGLHVWIEPFVVLGKEACDSLDTAAKAVRHVHCARHGCHLGDRTTCHPMNFSACMAQGMTQAAQQQGMTQAARQQGHVAYTTQ